MVTTAPRAHQGAQLLLPEVLARIDNLEILAVSAGSQALSEIRARPCAIIFLEADLTDGSGIVVLKEISRFSPSTCVIVMAGNIPSNELEDVIVTYNHYYLPKPFEILQIKSLTKRILAQKAESGWVPEQKREGGSDRRKWARKPHNDNVQCCPDPETAHPDMPESFPAEVLDVCPGGVGIRTGHPLPPGQRVHFRGETALWEGIVRWSLVFGDQFRAGVQIA